MSPDARVNRLDDRLDMPCRFRTSLAATISLLLLVLAGGCGKKSDLQRTIVSGTVTYQDRAVEDGFLRFVPIEATKGPPAATAIKHGEYSVTALGGVPVGTVRVEIRGFRQQQLDPQDPRAQIGLASESKQQYLPAKYNWQSELKETIEAGRRQELNFDLQ
jgi:hypothetical protein